VAYVVKSHTNNSDQKHNDMRKITADYIFPVSSEKIKNGVITINDAGEILAVDARSNHNEADLEVYEGVIVPGFVNTHCHLELSHMIGKVDTGTGLIPFITNVVKHREVAQELIDEAIRKGDEEMQREGIMAVGDICNKLDTAATKAKSPIRYYSFVEMFDFLQDGNAQGTFDGYKAVFDGQADEGGNRKSMVPHAPYSVSKKLFNLINEANAPGNTISIHNQETPPENELFQSKTGGFMDFYGGFGIPMEAFEATAQPAINYAINHMDPKQRTLFVHNTLSDATDIQTAHAWNKEVYWATCANANLYIENKLPNYQTFIDNNARMTIGTDSLTSNWQLSIIEEMKTIHRFQSYVGFERLLQWATLNGAQVLGYDKDLGSIEKGKTCGLNLLNLNKDLQLTAQTKVRKLA